MAEHGKEMAGYMSPRCGADMDGCDDLACVCRCHGLDQENDTIRREVADAIDGWVSLISPEELADIVIDALSSSGHLVPEGSEVREEFGVQFAHRADWDHGWAFIEVYEDRDEADRLTAYMDSLGPRPARTMRRIAAYGPWTPTEPEEKP